MPDFEIPLEIFGQDPNTAFATPSIFFWPLQDSEETSRATSQLQLGLEKLSKAIPWVAGKVVKQKSRSNDTDSYTIVPSGPTPKLITRDYRTWPKVPSFDELVQKNFPIGSLDENVLSPMNVLPGRDDEEREAVFTVQCNRLRGGMAVNFVGNHQVLDGTGQEQLVYLLDKACRGEAFDADEIVTANLDKMTIVQPFDSDWQPPLDTMYTKPSTPAHSAVDPGKECVIAWVNWAFSKTALMDLKAVAMENLSFDFVSADDVLAAFIWQALARTKIARLGPSTKSTIGRAINPRRHLGIPASYIGYISNNAFSQFTLQELASSPLGHIASTLRMAVDPRTSNLRDTTREFATLLHRAADKSTVNMGARLDLASDLMVSSWANMRCYQFTFGFGLGLPTAFRRPLQAPVPGLIFLLPRSQDGDIVVAMGVRVDDLEALRADKEWIRFADYIG